MRDQFSNPSDNTGVQRTTLTGMLLSGATVPMLLLGVASVVAGSAAAALRGNLEILPATLCLFFAIFFQVAGTYWHFYIELKRISHSEDIDDAVRDEVTEGLPRTVVLREAAFAFLLLGVTVGLAILVMSGVWSLSVAIVLAAIVYLTFGGPRPLAHSPWGVLCTFLLFGPVGVIGTCLVQSGQEASSLLTYYDIEPSLYLSVVMGLMAVNCNIYHNMIRISADRVQGRRTLPMAVGPGVARMIFVANGFLWTAVLAWLSVVQNFNIWVTLAVPVLSLGVNLWLSMKLPEADHKPGLQFAVNLNMLFLALTVLVISVAYGAADDSARFIF